MTNDTPNDSPMPPHLQVLDQGAPLTSDQQRQLRDAFGRFATGVTVVTTCQPDGTPRGFTANSFTSVSLDPPLLLICIARTAGSCDSFAQCDHFAVNILADDQKALSSLFASRAADKFQSADWQPDGRGIPLLDGALAQFSCARDNLVEAGDHLILIGRVEGFGTTPGQPLGYYGGAYFDLGLDRALADAATTGEVTIGAVLARGDQVLLSEDAGGQITVPSAPAEANSVDGLSTALAGLGVTADIGHLYAVYQDSRSGTQRIIYHGRLQGAAPAGMRYFDLQDLPLQRVSDDAERAMLRRYAQESRHGRFGIYHGNEVEGVVHTRAGHHSYNI